MVDKIIFSSDMNIGKNAAENDEKFLYDCFVDHPTLEELKDFERPTSFILGSTGSGKTALLKMLVKNEVNCKFFEIHDFMMQYISNSDVIQFLQKLDVDLSIFFQALWRHVLVIEYIKQVTEATSVDKFNFIRNKLDKFTSKERIRKKLMAFVDSYESHFGMNLLKMLLK